MFFKKHFQLWGTLSSLKVNFAIRVDLVGWPKVVEFGWPKAQKATPEAVSSLMAQMDCLVRSSGSCASVSMFSC